MNDTDRDPIPVAHGVVPEVVVSAESIEEGPEAVLSSNSAVVDALAAELLLPAELAPNALRAASVGYYLAQLQSGGFALFAYNSALDPELLARIRSTLEAVAAPAHAARFELSLARWGRLSAAERDEFLDGDFFGENATRDALNEAEGEQEDLAALTASWLLSLPELHVLPASELDSFVASRAALVPDLEDRRRAAEADAETDMPGFERAIRALCHEVGARFETITVGDPRHQFEGASTLGWHFLSDRGHHVMVEAGNDAVMLDAARGVELARIPLSAAQRRQAAQRR